MPRTTILAFVLASTSFVAAAPPTQDSIRDLLAVTEARQLIDGSMAQMDQLMQGTMQRALQRALQGKPVTPKAQAALDKMRARQVALLKDEMDWSKLEPRFIDIYQRSFSQEEVDGMLAFYRTPVGRSVVAKMPQVMQHSMQMVQELVEAMAPRMQQITKDLVQELEASKE